MFWENPVRASTLEVVKKASLVKLNEKKIEELADCWLASKIEVPLWPKSMHLQTNDPQMMLDYLILLDSLNFCFWPKGQSRWEIWHNGEKYSGYYALAIALKRFFEKHPEKANLNYLRKISFDEFRLWLQGGTNLLFLKMRWEITRRISDYLFWQYKGDSRNFLLEGKHRLALLIPKIANELYSFDDTAYYKGEKIYLWKRAQILAMDIHGAFGRKGLGAFKDPEYATAFADYKLPQILFHFGILEYAPDLKKKINGGVMLSFCAKEEVEIRSATVWAVELLQGALKDRGRKLYPYEIDWLLWNESQKTKMAIPYHRTETIFY